MGDSERREHDERGMPAPADDELPSHAFLTALAHEIRNPLTPILGSAQVLRSLSTNPQQHHAIATIERQVIHLAHLLDSLVEAADLRRGELNLTMQQVDAAVLAKQALEAVRPKIEERRQHLFVTMPAVSVQMHCDPNRLVQVIQALLDNAHRRTPEGGSISLSVVSEGTQLSIEVSDDGYGIRPEQLPVIFNLFVPGDRLAPGENALGISLAIARNLVELHGGTIAAKSAGVGQGSCFTMRLPIAHAKPVPAQDELPTMALRRRVLIIEDNASVAEGLASGLAALGYSVVVAPDGASAVQLANEFKPEAAVIDIGLPDQEGYEVARQLRNIPAISGALLIALSGHHLRAFRDLSDHFFFDRYLLKPVSPETLGALIKHVMKD
jgi:two-component system, sensor histidine kinase